MNYLFNILIGCSLFLVFCGCAMQAKTQRKIASEVFISPFTAQAVTKRQTVDAVIGRLGPVRNQVNTQLCVGNAVADAATFYTGKKVSAFSVSVRNFQKRKGLDYIFFNPGGVIASQVSPQSRYMIGLASSTLLSSLDATLCEDDQPLDSLSYRDQNLKQLWEAYNSFRSYIGPTAPVEYFEKIQVQLSKIMPSLNDDDFIQNISPYQPLDYALGDWFDRQCKIMISKNLNVEVVGNEIGRMSGDQVVAALDQALGSGSMAVVHYDAGVLRALDASFWQSVIGFHVSSIVAKSQVDGTSYYLLRNSWGSSCHIYAPSVASRCDRGHIWLTEDEVRSHVTSVAYYLSHAK